MRPRPESCSCPPYAHVTCARARLAALPPSRLALASSVAARCEVCVLWEGVRGRSGGSEGRLYGLCCHSPACPRLPCTVACQHHDHSALLPPVFVCVCFVLPEASPVDGEVTGFWSPSPSHVSVPVAQATYPRHAPQEAQGSRQGRVLRSTQCLRPHFRGRGGRQRDRLFQRME